MMNDTLNKLLRVTTIKAKNNTNLLKDFSEGILIRELWEFGTFYIDIDWSCKFFVSVSEKKL